MTITFWAIAMLRTVARLSLFSFLGWTRSKPSDHLAALAELLSCSPRRARPRPRKTFRPRHVSREPVSAFTRDPRWSPFVDHRVRMCSRRSFSRSPFLRLSRSSASWSALGVACDRLLNDRAYSGRRISLETCLLGLHARLPFEQTHE